MKADAAVGTQKADNILKRGLICSYDLWDWY